MEKLTIRIKNEALKKIYGDEIVVNARGGKPIEKYWRNRIKDAELDKCVEVVKENEKSSTKAATKEKGDE